MISTDGLSFSDLSGIMLQGRVPRVWSLLVTVFGDMAQDENARISGTVLHDLMDLIGIKPEATRVALHRLRKDGWIDSQKQGRNSRYGLTAKGRAESAAASPKIYGREAEPDHIWFVVTEPIGAPDADWIKVAPQCFLAATKPARIDALSFDLTHNATVPKWVKSTVLPEKLVADCADVHNRLLQLQAASGAFAGLGALEIAALRTLIVHDWRRIVLKTPPLPSIVLPREWRGADCRRLTVDLLTALPEQSLTAEPV